MASVLSDPATSSSSQVIRALAEGQATRLPARAPAPVELTILMPCLNEAATLAVCIGKAQGFLARAGVAGEVLIADNGSSDGSIEIARSLGARVLAVRERGYGAALNAGIAAAAGRFVIMGDSDDSYDFENLDRFVERLRQGDQLVMGNRFQGGIRPGAMPRLHRYLGNPVLSFIGRLFFKSRIGDFHCGLRGFDRQAILGLKLRTTGMEFASEMVVKATLAGLRIGEVPTTLSPDGRDRAPHLRSWRDGWRHLRFLLMFSPRWLFLYPGLALLAVGLFAQAAILVSPLAFGGVVFDIHTMLYAAGASIVGLQATIFSVLTKQLGVVHGLLPERRVFTGFQRRFTLERGVLMGAGLALLGLALGVYSLVVWSQAHFATLDPRAMMRVAIPSVCLIVTGVELVFASFCLGFITQLDPPARSRD